MPPKPSRSTAAGTAAVAALTLGATGAGVTQDPAGASAPAGSPALPDLAAPSIPTAPAAAPASAPGGALDDSRTYTAAEVREIVARERDEANRDGYELGYTEALGDAINKRGRIGRDGEVFSLKSVDVQRIFPPRLIAARRVELPGPEVGGANRIVNPGESFTLDDAREAAQLVAAGVAAYDEGDDEGDAGASITGEV